MIEQDLLNGEINLGSTLKDLLAVTQGAWIETEKNGWLYTKLGSKFGIAIQEVDSNKTYMLPKTFDKRTGIIYIGVEDIKGDIIGLGQEAITAPITGIAIILIK